MSKITVLSTSAVMLSLIVGSMAEYQNVGSIHTISDDGYDFVNADTKSEDDDYDFIRADSTINSEDGFLTKDMIDINTRDGYDFVNAASAIDLDEDDYLPKDANNNNNNADTDDYYNEENYLENYQHEDARDIDNEQQGDDYFLLEDYQYEKNVATENEYSFKKADAINNFEGGYLLTQDTNINDADDSNYHEIDYSIHYFDIWGRGITWSITNFDAPRNNRSGYSAYNVQAGETINMTVHWTLDGTNKNRDHKSSIMQLYYGINDVFCTGVFSHMSTTREEGGSVSTFTAPNQPGIYSIRQSLSMLYNYNYTECGNEGKYEFATLQVIANSVEPSDAPSMITIPSAQPTLNPSTVPTNQPTLSYRPSIITKPIMQPTFHPSIGPSNQPSLSNTPSLSANPSIQSTHPPSTGPSKQLNLSNTSSISAPPKFNPDLGPNTQTNLISSDISSGGWSGSSIAILLFCMSACFTALAFFIRRKMIQRSLIAFPDMV